MDSTIIAETQAFITKQREALLQQRETIFTQQQELQRRLDEVNEMLRKFDAFEGKAVAPSRQQARARRSSGTRRGSKRDELLKVIREGNGLTRGEILEKMGLKGDKSGEMSVSTRLLRLPSRSRSADETANTSSREAVCVSAAASVAPKGSRPYDHAFGFG